MAKTTTNSFSCSSVQWFMAEDRAKRVMAQVRDVIAKEVRGADSEDSKVKPVEYEVHNGVAVISIVGVLTKYPCWYDEYVGFIPARCVMAALDKAMNDAMIDRVILLIDSPGGLVAGTNELAEQIAAYRRTMPGKPIDAIVSDQAASGGYYLASQCRRIACNAMGEVGSIGVYAVLVDDSKFWSDLGIEFETVSSGGVKGLGADGKVSQELIDEVKRGVMASYEKFVADVATGRRMSIEQARTLADGRMWIAPEALKLGLIDQVASVDAAMQAIYQETSTMNAEAFKTYAAEHPEAVAVYIEQGKTAGKTEACNAEIERAKAIAAACPNRPQLALDSFIAKREAEDVKVTVAALDAEAATHKASLEKAEADRKAAEQAKIQQDAEVAKLKEQLAFATGGQGAVGTGKAPQPVAAGSEFKQGDDPKKFAENEWDTKPEVHQGFSSKENYVAYRTAELKGQIRTGPRAPASAAA